MAFQEFEILYLLLIRCYYNGEKQLCKHIISYCIKRIKIICILHGIFTLALDLKINQFKLDMNDVNDLDIKIIIILMNLDYEINIILI